MILKTLKSFRYAFNGIRLVLKNENNAKVHLLATIAVLITGFYLRLSFRDWCWLLIAIALVWITETLNTTIEKLVDLIAPEKNEKAGAIKDMAAAAVLMASFFALTIGILIFYNAIFSS
jgi:diacylglycerol kinase